MQKSRAKTCTKQSHLNALNYSSHSLTYITAAIQIHSASMNKEGGGGHIVRRLQYNISNPSCRLLQRQGNISTLWMLSTSIRYIKHWWSGKERFVHFDLISGLIYAMQCAGKRPIFENSTSIIRVLGTRLDS